MAALVILVLNGHDIGAPQVGLAEMVPTLARAELAVFIRG